MILNDSLVYSIQFSCINATVTMWTVWENLVHTQKHNQLNCGQITCPYKQLHSLDGQKEVPQNNDNGWGLMLHLSHVTQVESSHVAQMMYEGGTGNSLLKITYSKCTVFWVASSAEKFQEMIPQHTFKTPLARQILVLQTRSVLDNVNLCAAVHKPPYHRAD